jgi:acetylornithine deacetylase
VGVNAIEYAAKLIVYVRDMADRIRTDAPRNQGFDVPFTTLQTGTIRGGIAHNIVPRDCEFQFEFRYLPGGDPNALIDEIEAYARSVLEPEMKQVAPDAAIEILRSVDVPGLDVEADHELAALARSLARNDAVGHVAYATEAGLFQQAGIPSIICGPGSIEQAHKPNEYITLEQIALCESFMERLTEELSR